MIPFVFVLYVVSFVDRVNVGFAALELNRDLHLSSAVYGFGAGIFFFGYSLFEAPADSSSRSTASAHHECRQLILGLVSCLDGAVRPSHLQACGAMMRAPLEGRKPSACAFVKLR